MASCSGSKVIPATIGGYGRYFQDTDSQSKGGLADVVFSTKAPPDIQPDLRIIAICGITDCVGQEETLSPSSEDELSNSSTNPRRKTGLGTLISNTASLFSMSKKMKRSKITQQRGRVSPSEDGCSFSDYFMFYHIFHGLGRYTKILCRVSLMSAQEQVNTGSCANRPETWSQSTDLTDTAKEQGITAWFWTHIC